KTSSDDSPVRARGRSSSPVLRTVHSRAQGTDALSPLRLRPWQIDLAGSVLDAAPMPVTAGIWVAREPASSWRRLTNARPESYSGSPAEWSNSTRVRLFFIPVRFLRATALL